MAVNEFQLPDLTRANRATLKRCAGKTLSQSPKALSLFYTLKPAEIRPGNEEKYFAVLCIASMWDPDERERVLPFAECMKRMRKDQPSFDKRMEHLLSTSWSDEDGFLSGKIAALARMIKNSGLGIKPDFAKLYRDLIFWNGSESLVQKEWARTYYVSGKTLEEEESK